MSITPPGIRSELKSWKFVSLPPDRSLEQPPEILATIFKNIWNGSVLLPPSSHAYPWSLGHVCSRWRKVLWSLPSFWSNIDIQPFTHLHEKLDATRSIIRKNSVRQALIYIISNTSTSLSLCICDRDADYISSVSDDISDIIFSNASRFNNLSLGYVNQKTFVSLLNLPPQSLNLLESLSVRFRVDDISHMPMTSALGIAPNLHSVDYTISNIALIPSYVPQILRFPFERMANIHMHSMQIPLNIIQGMLLSSPCLVSCTFVISASVVILRKHQATMYCLKTLNLENPHSLGLDTFLASFLTPVLEDLTISSPRPHLQAVASLIIHSHCSVKHLYLGSKEFGVHANHSNGVEPFIEQLPPSVVSLDMSWVMSGLIFRKIQQGFLPMLENISLHVDPEGLEAFAELINSYIDGTASAERRLNCVHIHYWNAEPELIARCMGWATLWAKIEGLKMVIEDSYTKVDLMTSLENEGDDMQ